MHDPGTRSNGVTAVAGANEKKIAGRVAALAAVIGLIYGYDSGSIGGALVFLKQDYGLSTLWVSIVTTVVVLGSLVGAAICPRVINRYGRKVTMVIVAAGFTVFAGLSAVPLGVEWLTAVRLLLGVTIGLSTVAAPIFISEFAPEQHRGRLGTSYQFFTSAGVVISLVVDWALAESGSWELMLGLAAVPSLFVFFAFLKFPDSPRWYAMQGRYVEAEQTLAKIEPLHLVSEKLDAIKADLAHEEKGTFREMFSRKFLRPTLFVIGFGFFVQITGTNTILYYSPLIFEQVGIVDSGDSILVSAVVQVFAVVGVILSMLLVDRWGRRPLLLIGTIGMIIGHLGMMLIFMQGELNQTTGYLAVGAVALFFVGFYFGIGSLIWVYTGEAFPARLRSVGAAALLLADFAANLIATLAFPNVLDHFGGATGFGAFLVLSIAAWIFMFKLAPETKGRSLEQIRSYWEQGAKWR